jgi:hypothetical protein
MKELARLLQLRVSVGFLGERSQYDWWPTAFFGAASKQFLEPVFVKSALHAQYHGVIEAARRVHDEHLSAGSFHLFRFPEEMEQDLFAVLKRSAVDASAPRMPETKEHALSTLRALTGSAGNASEGPTLVGSIGDLSNPKTIGEVAGAYLSAFTSGTHSYPYFASRG